MRESVAVIFEQGGWVTYALVVVSVLLWAAMWLRARSLRRGFAGSVREYIEKTSVADDFSRPPGVLSRFLDQAKTLVDPGDRARLTHLAQRTIRELATMRSVVKTLVAVAPLLGLLGTVAGMVEMFGSLHGGTAGMAQEATAAGGISTALTTTQLGLVISAPGLIAARLLSRREVQLKREINEALSVLAGGGVAP